jgi:D-alanyl-lipoteichoic acid acyltransferase DltB (MBOAT superfamily)
MIDYFVAVRIEQARGGRRRAWLGLSIAANLGILFVFKYADFFSAVLHTGLAPLRLALPIGISFHTFQAVGYTVDVYRRKVAAERNLTEYALFVAFFPQMVAGPIERADRLLPQFRRRVSFDFGRMTDGLRMVLRGLIKKAVIADLAAPAVNQIYGHPRDFPAPMLLLGTVLFSAQIYCDSPDIRIWLWGWRGCWVMT